MAWFIEKSNGFKSGDRAGTLHVTILFSLFHPSSFFHTGSLSSKMSIDLEELGPTVASRSILYIFRAPSLSHVAFTRCRKNTPSPKLMPIIYLRKRNRRDPWQDEVSCVGARALIYSPPLRRPICPAVYRKLPPVLNFIPFPVRVWTGPLAFFKTRLPGFWRCRYCPRTWDLAPRNKKKPRRYFQPHAAPPHIANSRPPRWPQMARGAPKLLITVF